MTTGATSIPVFCKAHGISRAHFYNLMKRGEAPRTLVCGRRRLVSDDAAAEWRRSMEDLTLPSGENRLADQHGRRTPKEERT
jgi:predicted DNA-binding transcriptional regulator AlpA